MLIVPFFIGIFLSIVFIYPNLLHFKYFGCCWLSWKYFHC